MSQAAKKFKGGIRGFTKKPYVIDGKDHLVGRLSSVVAKLLLNGEDVVVLRCEGLNYSGNIFRNRIKYLRFLHKRCNVNPKRGPFHQRAPAKIFQRCVRGMVPFKTKRGKDAFNRLTCFEGVPEKYHKCRFNIVPQALRHMRVMPGRKFCDVGRLSHLVGWRYQQVVASLETKRNLAKTVTEQKIKQKRVFKAKEKSKFAKHSQMAKVNKYLALYGH